MLATSIASNIIDPNNVIFGSEEYYAITQLIVEPEGPPEILEEYFNFMDTDPQNWGSFIVNTIGEEYRQIVENILKNGYKGDTCSK